MKYLFFIISIFLIISCNPYQYVASNQYVPLNKEKYEFNAAFTYNSFQLGYTPMNHIGVFYSRFRRNKMFESDSFTSLFYRTHYGRDGIEEWNMGCSYYSKFDSLVFEVLAGYGEGKMFYENSKYLSNPSNYNFKIRANKSIYYLQPDLGIRYNKHVEFGLFTKIIFCQYLDITSTKNISSAYEIEHQDKYFLDKRNLNLYFIEPGMVARFGFEQFKLQFLISKTINLNSRQINYQSMHCSICLFLDLNFFNK